MRIYEFVIFSVCVLVVLFLLVVVVVVVQIRVDGGGYENVCH